MSVIPLKLALKSLIFELKDSALVFLLLKKLRILSILYLTDFAPVLNSFIWSRAVLHPLFKLLFSLGFAVAHRHF